MVDSKQLHWYNVQFTIRILPCNAVRPAMQVFPMKDFGKDGPLWHCIPYLLHFLLLSNSGYACFHYSDNGVHLSVSTYMAYDWSIW